MASSDPLKRYKFVRLDQSESFLQQGDSVKLHSLRSEEGRKLEGQVGVLGGFDSGKGRWEVSIDGVQKGKFKPSNLGLYTQDKVQAYFISPRDSRWTTSLHEASPVAGRLKRQGEDDGTPALYFYDDPNELTARRVRELVSRIQELGLNGSVLEGIQAVWPSALSIAQQDQLDSAEELENAGSRLLEEGSVEEALAAAQKAVRSNALQKLTSCGD